MPPPPGHPHPGRSASQKVTRRFWQLVAVTVLATGSLTSALAAPPSPLTGLRVAISGLVLIASLTLTVRVVIAVERARKQTRRTQT